MKSFTSILVTVLFLCTVITSYSQEALWQLDFEKEVEWTKVTESAILLVGTSDMTLMGIDSRNGSVIWESDLMKGAKGVKGADGKKMEISSIFDQYLGLISDEEVPELSDYAVIKYSTLMGFKNFSIINIMTGEVIISPRKAELPVQKVLGKEMATFNFNGSGYIPSMRAAVISASWQDFNQKGNPWVVKTMIIDLPSGNTRWQSDALGIDALPATLPDGNLLFAGKYQIAKINAKDGAYMWSFNTSEKNQTFESFDTSLDLQSGYFFEKKKNSGQLSALNLNDGKPIWSFDIKLKVVPQMFAIRDGVVVVDDKWLSLYNLDDGSVKWQAKKAVGDVIDLGNAGIGVAARGTRLLMLDRNTGEIKWDEKVKGIGIDQICAKGIMYSDLKGRLGLITFGGDKVWDKKGMLEVPSVRYRYSFEKELMYISGDLYEVDLMTGDYKLLVSGINKSFEGDEDPNSMELVNNGILLSSSNNLMMIEPDGAQRWHKHWPAPEMSLAAKIAIRTMQVVATAAAVSNSVAAQNTNSIGSSKMYQSQSDQWSNVASSGSEEARKKFTASKSKGNLKVILAVIGKGGQKAGAGFVKVDKTTGDELATFLVGEKEPVYDFDPISGQVFLKTSKKQIVSYTF